MPSIPDAKTKKEETRDYTPVYEQFGVVFSTTSGAEAIADECPFCGKDRFYVNRERGVYDCKHCKAKGNVQAFLTWVHATYFAGTTAAHYSELRAKRGISPQRLKHHELAYDPERGEWLIPFKNPNGGVVNFQRYNPKTGRKDNLKGLSTSLYNLNRLSSDRKKILFLCEGPFDAIALDYHLANNRSKYDILAIPTQFKECWAEYLKGRKVRALFDNDDGGKAHAERLRKLVIDRVVEAEEVRLLNWPPDYPNDINDLVRDPRYRELSIPGWAEQNCSKVTVASKLVLQRGFQKEGESGPTDWIWPNRLPCGTYISFSGWQGTYKSTIMQEIAARYSQGIPMPMEEEREKEPGEPPMLPPGPVLYLYVEDNRKRVEDGYKWAGGVEENWFLMPAVTKDDDTLNVLEHLPEMEELIREHGIRLVIIDGQNSVVGAPVIATDMQARNNVSNKLHQFAQKLNICLIGVRNENIDGRALGAQSMADIGRCVLRAVKDGDSIDPPYCKLEWVKVSDRHPRLWTAIPYSVDDLGMEMRKIAWGKEKPAPVDPVDVPPPHLSYQDSLVLENLKGTLAGKLKANLKGGKRVGVRKSAEEKPTPKTYS